ncbi:MAG: SMC-Scp complex subunit ScpB [Gammaproteobacteria bacterium]|nr:SMC-Scp complex subunit ScpB [Gammaproteobacteria bacterium]
MTPEKLQNLLEAALMVYGKPMSIDKMMQLFEEDKQPSASEIKQALSSLNDSYEDRGLELKEVASGYRFQARQEYAEWIARLWEEKAPRYSRALLETLALIAYRQPITRSEIEDVRGVSVSSHIIKTLLEREWVRVVGHRDVPGRPALYATTKDFLDYFDLSSLEQLPTLSEIRDLDKINAELDLDDKVDDSSDNSKKISEAGSAEGHSDKVDTDSESDTNEPESSESDSANEYEMASGSDEDSTDDINLSSDDALVAKASMPEEFDDEDILEAIELADKANLSADESTFNDAFEPESLTEENDDDVSEATDLIEDDPFTDDEPLAEGETTETNLDDELTESNSSEDESFEAVQSEEEQIDEEQERK